MVMGGWVSYSYSIGGEGSGERVGDLERGLRVGARYFFALVVGKARKRRRRRIAETKRDRILFVKSHAPENDGVEIVVVVPASIAIAGEVDGSAVGMAPTPLLLRGRRRLRSPAHGLDVRGVRADGVEEDACVDAHRACSAEHRRREKGGGVAGGEARAGTHAEEDAGEHRDCDFAEPREGGGEPDPARADADRARNQNREGEREEGKAPGRRARLVRDVGAHRDEGREHQRDGDLAPRDKDAEGERARGHFSPDFLNEV